MGPRAEPAHAGAPGATPADGGGARDAGEPLPVGARLPAARLLAARGRHGAGGQGRVRPLRGRAAGDGGPAPAPRHGPPPRALLQRCAAGLVLPGHRAGARGGAQGGGERQQPGGGGRRRRGPPPLPPPPPARALGGARHRGRARQPQRGGGARQRQPGPAPRSPTRGAAPAVGRAARGRARPAAAAVPAGGRQHPLPHLLGGHNGGGQVPGQRGHLPPRGEAPGAALPALRPACPPAAAVLPRAPRALPHHDGRQARRPHA